MVSSLAIFFLLGTGVKFRLAEAFHPLTPSQTVRAELLTDRDDALAPPRIIRLRELPTSSSNPNRRRVAFEIEVSAQEGSRDVRVKWLQSLLAKFQRSHNPNAATVRASLRRITQNVYKIQDVAAVNLTGDGWQVDRGSFDFSRLHGWFEDIYFRE